MFLERMLFQVTPGKEDDFIKADEEIWTNWLRKQPGFIQKSSSRYSSGVIELRLFWKAEQDMKTAALRPDMKVVETLFRNRLGPTYNLLSS